MRDDLCDRTREVIAHRDGTSAIPDEIALHFDGCEPCRARFDAGRVELDAGAYERLDEERRRAIMAALAWERARTSRCRAMAAVAAVAGVGMLAGGFALTRLVDYGPAHGGDEEAVATALVEDHIRYLLSVDLTTPEAPQAVLAHLQTHVDFPLRLPELPDARLTGGRRCYLLGRRAALLFFDSPQGALSFFVLESGGFEPPGRACGEACRLACRRLKGYKLVSWEESGLLYAVVGPDSRALERVAGASREALGHEP